jgi:hypothetical protein
MVECTKDNNWSYVLFVLAYVQLHESSLFNIGLKGGYSIMRWR